MARKPDIETLTEQLKFEKLVSVISAKMISLSTDAVDDAVCEGLQTIGEFFDADRAVIAQILPDVGGWRATHAWLSERFGTKESDYTSDRVLPNSFPSLTEHLEKEGFFLFENPDAMPPEWDYEREFIDEFGIKAGVTVRLSVGGDFLWVIKLDALGAERRWPGDVVHRLRFAGDIFANALNRKRTEEAMDELIRFETLATALSTGLMNVSANEIDKVIEDGLRLIGEFFGADRATISQYLEEEKRFWPSHLWLSETFDRSQDFSVTYDGPQVPSLIHELKEKGALVLGCIETIPEEWSEEWKEVTRSMAAHGLKAGVAVALSTHGVFVGLITIASLTGEQPWTDDLVQRLRFVGEIFAKALLFKSSEETIHLAFSEIDQLKEQVETGSIRLDEEITLEHSYDEIIGSSEGLKDTLGQAEQVAGTDSTVLILGETGTGKELLARAIHTLSSRGGRPMVKINCAAMPSTLIESELFGREKGAYTGALAKQEGRFEIAHGTTIFLDEVGELSADVQAKLLRVLQEGQFERLGSPDTIEVDVRVIAATNRDLGQAVKDRTFREDLYYRLNVFPITIPPLRERRDDIPQLLWSFVREFCDKMGKQIDTIPRRTMDALQKYSWPGNIRELRNVIERAMILAKGSTLPIELPDSAVSARVKDMALSDVERAHIVDVLDMTAWRIRGKSGAAEILGLKPTTLEARMRKLGIERDR